MKFYLFETYRSFIFNSVGSKAYRNSYFEENNAIFDLLDNGDKSCAFFVSSVLKQFGLIQDLHCTVKGAVADLEKSGWRKINHFFPGCVILWASNGRHRHIGFYYDGLLAVSNSSLDRIIKIHNYEEVDGSKRRIEAFYWKELIS